MQKKKLITQLQTLQDEYNAMNLTYNNAMEQYNCNYITMLQKTCSTMLIISQIKSNRIMLECKLILVTTYLKTMLFCI